MSIATIGDVLDASLQHPETESCPHCGGTGSRNMPYIYFPALCADCKGTGKREKGDASSPAPAPAQPGIGEQLRPNLPKRLRDW